MGKATITGGGANGLYNISIKYDNARAKARLDAINSQIDQLNNTLIPQALDNKNIAQAQHQVALNYLNSYLASVTPEQFDPAISGQLTVQAMKTKSVYDEANKAYKQLLLQKTGLEKEKTKLQNAPEDEAAQAWCADFTEDLTGDVGVIDVGYEDKDIRIIRPHAIEGAGYNAASDGIISSFFNHTAHQLYTNRAYLPAMAKWKPRYRTGSITSLTGDTCNVSLDPYNSSQQTLDINQSTSLTDVPIQYMTCNGAAFEVGDSVVVDFSLEWATPRVVGFVSNPRSCDVPHSFLFQCSPIDVTSNETIAHPYDQTVVDPLCATRPDLGSITFYYDSVLNVSRSGSLSESKDFNFGNLTYTANLSTTINYTGYNSSYSPAGIYYSYYIDVNVTINGYTELFSSVKILRQDPYEVSEDFNSVTKIGVDADKNTYFNYTRTFYVSNASGSTVDKTTETHKITIDTSGSRVDEILTTETESITPSLGINALLQVTLFEACDYTGAPPDYPTESTIWTSTYQPSALFFINNSFA